MLIWNYSIKHNSKRRGEACLALFGLLFLLVIKEMVLLLLPPKEEK